MTPPRQPGLARTAPRVVEVGLLAANPDAEHHLAGAPPEADQVTVSGTVRSLALLAWGRLPLADPALTITGDEVALRAVLEAGLTP